MTIWAPGRAGRWGRAGLRWSRLLLSRHGAPGLRVFYGHDRVPIPGEPVAGGTAKFQRLATRFPNHPTDFTVLYLGSTWLPRDLGGLLRIARRRGAPVVLNQNGVGYPGWAGREGAEEFNRPLRRILADADHVLYQSEFCKRAADELVTPPGGGWEILHNAVDVEQLTPAEAPPADGPILLLGGDQYHRYRLELGLRTLQALLPLQPEARLLVTGSLVMSVERMVAELGLEGRVDVLGRYAQRDAPAIYRRAHVLLHTKVNDPCPSVVIEAMACGLPVVYPMSGGVPELVGDEAGVGVPHLESWERDEPPRPEELAGAVDGVLGDLARYSAAARARAVTRFALEPWLDRHGELFETLLGLPGLGGERATAR
jgi:glycosyltransferase involved in cell wall biosynthesis